VKFFPLKSIWLLQLPAVFQLANAIFLSFVAVYDFVPSIYIVFAIIFWEGLLGGSIYVNVFYLMSQTFHGEEKEFCLGATSMSYGLSITLSAVLGIFYFPFLKHERQRLGHPI
jgi:battenin